MINDMMYIYYGYFCNADTLDVLPCGVGESMYLAWSKNEMWVQQQEEDNEKIVTWGWKIIKADLEDLAKYEKGLAKGHEV
jgi:hypothetical protein